jgi:predicted amidohydrolase
MKLAMAQLRNEGSIEQNLTKSINAIYDAAEQGAELILIPTVNTKSEPLEMFEWEIRVQAFWNSVAIAMCNRVGAEDDMIFAGESIVADANGNVIVKADDTEGLVFAEIDLSTVGKVRSEKPYTTLRRREWYR